MKKSIVNLSNLFVGLSALAFILFCFVLSFYQRPPSDDIYFISLSKHKSVWENVSFMYYTWSGRWTSMLYYFFVIGSSATFFQVTYFFFLYYTVTLLLLLYAVNALLRFGIHQLSGTELTKKSSLTYSILFIACFHFFTFEAIETWWWPCASFSYLLGMVLLLVGTALLIRNKNKYIEFPLIGICFTYVGGCYEIYAFIITSLFGLIFLYYWRNRATYEAVRIKYGSAFLIAFCCLVVSMIICFVAPGNYARITTMENIFGEQPHTINQVFAGLSNRIFQKKYVLAFLLSALWMLLGLKLQKTAPGKINRKQFVRLLWVSIIPIVLSVLVCPFFQVVALEFFPVPAKGWTFTSLGITVFFCALFLFIGYEIRISAAAASFAKLVIPLCTTVFLFRYAYTQYRYVTVYTRAYDDLFEQLVAAKKSNYKGTLLVSKLPNPGMLSTVFIGEQYVNDPIKDIFELECEIKLKK